MKILMRNIGMCLFVVNKLRAQGIDNVQINMDWQHLLMNGEHLPEYAALLASEGLLGHQHANSGWGTFDDDNMVGTTAFMETLELRARVPPVWLRLERRAARLRPVPLHRGPGRRGQALGPAVAVHRLGRGEDRRRRAARGPAAQGRGPRLRARLRRPRRVMSEPLVGIDVGTSGVKGVAIDPDGTVLARVEAGYPLSTPAARLGRAGSRGLGRGDRIRARAAAARRRALRGHRAERSDARTRRARRRRIRAAPGDPLERPAHRRRVRGDRANDRARATDRADGQSRAPGVHRARSCCGSGATSRTCTRGSRGSRCRRTTCACGCAASTRPTSPTHRARCCSTSRRGAGATRSSTHSAWTTTGCPTCSRARPCRGRRRTASRSPPAAATRRRARSASASTAPARCRSCSAPRASCSPRSTRFAADPQARVHAFCHAVPGAWHAMGVMLSAAGSLRWLRDTVAAGASYDSLMAEAAAWPPGTEGLLFLPYLAGERTPHADPDARGAFTGLSDPPRSRRARPRGARRRRVRLARLARPDRRAWRATGSPRSAASPAAAPAASCGCGSSRRCWSCRSSASRSTRAPRSAPRSSAASRPGSGPTCDAGVASDRQARRARSSRCPSGSRSTASGARRSGRCIRRSGRSKAAR